ncbi:MAG: imidazole glycerol phosphate synthase subunit HisF [Gammaproteobacteria bacterium]|nr:imidazole glycerol phosphate synthase subunit HisF [Gammaproteobacteria bacterium]
MLSVRVFPTLLIKGRGLYKGAKFKDHKYVGDPINAVRIFNDKEVDEIAVIDIEGSAKGQPIDVEFVRQFAAEAFMPLTVGGGVSTVEQARSLLQAGAEKVLINTAAVERPALITELADTFGSSSVVVGIDYAKTFFGKNVVAIQCGRKNTRLDVVEWAREAERLGAGEVLITSVERDGDRNGYDVPLLKTVTAALTIPVVAGGGLGAIEHMQEAVSGAGVSALTGGSFFVFHGPRRAVLISFPPRPMIDALTSRSG